MYKIIFFVPETHVESVKNALFAEGAGRYKNYSHCSWQILGEGQFMALQQSQPFIGQKNQISKIPEYYVEMICEETLIRNAITALKKAHPYEEPSYQVLKMESF